MKLKKFNIELKTIKSKNDNDCWCTSISKFTGKKYEEIYKIFKPFLYDDGSLDTYHLRGYFRRIEQYNVYSDIDIELNQALPLYNNQHGILIRCYDEDSNGHLFYVEKDTIYDTITNDMLWWFIKKYKVDFIVTHRMEYA